MTTKTQMDIFDFGRRLIETKDLDPVSNLLWEAKLPPDQLHRWPIAYWCFYNVGVASVLSEVPETDFFRALMEATPRTRYKRGTERRHFRGDNAIQAVASLEEVGDGSCTTLINSLTESCTLSDVLNRTRKWKGFGPWIGFKIADMLERLYLAPQIQFSPKNIFDLFDGIRFRSLLWR